MRKYIFFWIKYVLVWTMLLGIIPYTQAQYNQNTAKVVIGSGTSVYIGTELRQETGGTIQNNGTIFISGNWVNNSADDALTGIGKVQFVHDEMVTLSGTFLTNFYNLEFKNQFTTIASPITIENNLNFISGMVYFQTVGMLSTTATISNETNDHYATGKLGTSRNTNSTQNFGNLGITINPRGNSLGFTTVIREAGEGVSVTHLEKNSLDRIWDIQMSNPPNQKDVEVNISWLSQDDNGVDLTDSQIWTEDELGWVGYTPSTDFSANTADFKIQNSAKYSVGGVGTLSLTGTITELEFGLNRVNVDVSNGFSTVSDFNGFYTVFISSGDTGFIEISKVNANSYPYVFTSANRIVEGAPFLTVYRPQVNNFKAWGTYFFEGTVTNQGEPIEGVSVGLFHAETNELEDEMRTNSDGEYLFFVTSGFEGYVRAYERGFIFDPPIIEFTNELFNLRKQDFWGQTVQTIEGNISEIGMPLDSITLILSTGDSVFTDTEGNYVAFVSSGFTGSIQPIEEGYIFDPQKIEFSTAIGNLENQDFLAQTLYRIEGTITEANSIQSDVTIRLSNGYEAVSDESGFYTAFVSSGFSGTAQAQKDGYVFDPQIIEFSSVLSPQIDQNFEAETAYELTGQVTDLVTQNPISEVKIGFINDSLNTVQTNTNGFYTVYVRSGFTDKMYASKASYDFAPQTIDLESITENLTEQHFIGYPLYEITGQLLAGDTAVNDATIFIEGYGEVTTDTNGNYSFFVSANYSGTITPKKEHYNFDPPSFLLNDVNGNVALGIGSGDLVRYPIMGEMTLNDTIPLADIQITVGDSITVTDADGFYTVYQPAGFIGTIQPDKILDYFTPENYELLAVYDSVFKQDFRVYTAPIDWKIEGTMSEDSIFCSNALLAINFEKLPNQNLDSVQFSWSNDTKKSNLSVQESGEYSVEIKVPTFYPTTLNASIQISPNALVVPWGADSILCIGATAILETPTDSDITRIWRQKNGDIFTEMSNVNAINQEVGVGVYQLEMTNGVCEALYEIEVKEALEMIFDSLESVYYLCDDSPIILNGISKNAQTYEWIASNGFTTQEVQPEISVAGNYTLLATDEFGCTVEQEVEVFDDEKLTNLFIFQSEVHVGDTVVFVNLSTKSEGSNTEPNQFNWDLGGLATATDEIQTEFIFEEVGEYPISLTINNGFCATKVTAPLNVIPMPEGGRAERVYPKQSFDYQVSKINLYPNPAEDNLKLELYNLPEKQVQAEVYDSFGREVIFSETENISTLELNVSELATGVYTVKITSGNWTQTIRFVKM